MWGHHWVSAQRASRDVVIVDESPCRVPSERIIVSRSLRCLMELEWCDVDGELQSCMLSRDSCSIQNSLSKQILGACERRREMIPSMPLQPSTLLRCFFLPLLVFCVYSPTNPFFPSRNQPYSTCTFTSTRRPSPI